MQKLRAHGLTTDSVLDMTEKTLGDLIYPVGFWKRKVQYLKKTAQILKDTYEDDIPDNVDDLCKVRVKCINCTDCGFFSGCLNLPI